MSTGWRDTGLTRATRRRSIRPGVCLFCRWPRPSRTRQSPSSGSRWSLRLKSRRATIPCPPTSAANTQPARTLHRYQRTSSARRRRRSPSDMTNPRSNPPYFEAQIAPQTPRRSRTRRTATRERYTAASFFWKGLGFGDRWTSELLTIERSAGFPRRAFVSYHFKKRRAGSADIGGLRKGRKGARARGAHRRGAVRPWRRHQRAVARGAASAHPRRTRFRGRHRNVGRGAHRRRQGVQRRLRSEGRRRPVAQHHGYRFVAPAPQTGTAIEPRLAGESRSPSAPSKDFALAAASHWRWRWIFASWPGTRISACPKS